MCQPCCLATKYFRRLCFSKPFNIKITHLLYFDNLKVFASSTTKLERVLRSITKEQMENVCLQWNPKKCYVLNIVDQWHSITLPNLAVAIISIGYIVSDLYWNNSTDYHFTNRESMLESIKNGDFIESAEYNKNLYGTR